MSRGYIFTALLFVMPSGVLAQDALTTLELGTQFCSLVQEGEQSITLDALLSPSLAGAVSAALARNDAIQAAAPDEKPPLGDGIPWMSWPDRPDTCTVGAAAPGDHEAILPISYGFNNAPQAAYTDSLVLVQEGGTWRVDDVILINEQHLRTILETAFQQ